MTLIQILNKLKTYAEGQFSNPLVMVGSLYENMNTKELTYPCINIDIANTMKRDNETIYNFYIYYADRLNESGDNLLQIQSDANTSLQLILGKIMDAGNINLDEVQNIVINPFKLKFTDVCAGGWMQVNVHTIGMDLCDDGSQTNTMYITANGNYDVEEYDRVDVNVSGGGEYDSGYTDATEKALEHKIPMYFEALRNTQIGFRVEKTPAFTVNLEYSKDNANWTEWNYTDPSQSAVTLAQGERLYIRGNNPNGFTNNKDNYYQFTTIGGAFVGDVNLGGNFVSIFNKSMEPTAIPSQPYCFTRLFGHNGIVRVSRDLFGSVTSLYNGCFRSIFTSCRQMTNMPDLPWSVVPDEAFDSAFSDCDGLVDLSDYLLPATDVRKQSYQRMFYNCDNLEKAPRLFANGSGIETYKEMFMQCPKLNYVHTTMTENIDSTNMKDWLKYVSGTGTFVKNVLATGWTLDSVDGIPSGWTVLTHDVPLSSTAITANGIYTNINGGWNSVEVNVSGGSNIIEISKEEYDALVSAGTIDTNALYVISGYTDNYETGYASGFQSGYTSGFTSGYTSGNTDGFQSGYTSGYTNGYTSGETDGFQSGYTSGRTDGESAGFNEGYTSGYTDGYQSGHTDGVQSGFTSGYTSGYTSGHTDGYSEGYTSGHTDGVQSGFTSGYTSGSTDGFQNGYASGHTDGYNEGFDSGFTSGYTSGNTDGFQSGYTSGYTDGYSEGYTSGETVGFQSGYTSGYTSGHTDGYNKGYEDGEQSVPLTSTSITSNGVYVPSEGGWNSVTVNVPSVTTQTLTQAQYDALQNKDPMVIYLISN